METSDINNLQYEPPIINDCIWSYFPDEVLSENIANSFDRTEIYSPRLNELIENYNLSEWENEITIFRIYLRTKWAVARIHKFSNSSSHEYDKELRRLKEFLELVSQDEISEIQIISKVKNRKVKISNPDLFDWFSKFIDIDLFYEGLQKLGTLTQKSELSPETSKDSRAYSRLFVQKELKQFYLFLLDEVKLKNTVALNFITDFAEFFNLSWKHIQLSEATPPQKYLRNTFDKL